MNNKRRVLVAEGGIKKRSLTLEVGGVIDDKYILVGVIDDDAIILLHLTKRELLKNVIDLCEED